MRELCARLGNPERSFRVLHVVGTNGKSSVAEFARQLLAEQGMRAGAYISPHLGSWSERVRLPSGAGPARYARAVQQAASAAAELGAEEGSGAAATQFEVATAAAFLALSEDGAEVAAIEAGLGGRLDATNVCTSDVVALTTVALDHTQWLGDTVEEIAAEKLAVVDPGATVVIGSVPQSVAELARDVASQAGSRLIEAPHDAGSDFRAQNLAVARCAVEALSAAGLTVMATTGHSGEPASLPARAELIEGDPPVLLDLAHNPAAAGALAASHELAGRPVVGCVALLDDKDLRRYAAALAPVLTELMATETGPLPGSARPGAGSHSAASVAAAFRRAGVGQVSALADPRTAVAACLARARELGGLAMITGSHYLLRHAWIPGRDRS